MSFLSLKILRNSLLYGSESSFSFSKIFESVFNPPTKLIDDRPWLSSLLYIVYRFDNVSWKSNFNIFENVSFIVYGLFILLVRDSAIKSPLVGLSVKILSN